MNFENLTNKQREIIHAEACLWYAKQLYSKYEQLVKFVAPFYNVTYEEIKSGSREGNISEARQMCAYFLKNYTKLSLQEIAKIVGITNHASVIKANKNINLYIETNQLSIDSFDRLEHWVKYLLK